ncbi:MAG: ATPase, T2SS/T4P/T4SS family, partial [Planctomycetota bacterium]
MGASHDTSSDTTSGKEHQVFWRAIAGSLGAGKSVVESLWQAAGEAGPEFGQIAVGLIDSIEKGKTLSEAMQPHESTFGRSIRTMVWAGEAGGVLDVIAGRIADALAEGSFGPPQPGIDPQARYWRAMGRLMSSGVPLKDVLDLVAEEAAVGELAEATRAIWQKVMDGSDLATAMGSYPDVFAFEIVQAVGAGERAGELDVFAFRIADALDAGDLSRLDAETAAAPGGDEGEDPRAREYLGHLLVDAVRAGASDLHFDPSEGRGHVRMRIDGILRPVEPPPTAAWDAVIRRIKTMAALDVSEQRVPQDGIVLTVVNGRQMDIRVSTLPVWRGQRVVLRLITRDAVCLDMDKLGMSDQDLARARRL